jgi:hypothetical protein|tara:strand:+ start:827 stop:1102 length:276 start_codon:yes stop_codon:yes gene_type:complete
MNGKKSKEIRRHAKVMLLDWLKDMVTPEQAKDINEKNFKDYLPKEGHVFANRKFLLSAYSFKWFVKKIKQIVKKENKDVRSIRFEQLLRDE